MKSSTQSKITAIPSLLQTLSAAVVAAQDHELERKIKLNQISLMENGVWRKLARLLEVNPDDIEDLEQTEYPGARENIKENVVQYAEYNTIIEALCCKDESQFKRLKDFRLHLSENSSPEIQVCNLKGNNFTSLVTYPASALLHIYCNVSPAYIMVQDLTHCGESNLIEVMNATNVAMRNFGLFFEIIHDQITPKLQRRAIQKSPKRNSGVLWRVKIPLMLRESDAALNLSLVYRQSVKSEETGRLLEEKYKTSEQGQSTSKENDVEQSKRLKEITSSISTRDEEISWLKETVRCLETKLDECECKLKKRKETGVENIETQTTNEYEDEMKSKIASLENDVQRLTYGWKKSEENSRMNEMSFRIKESQSKNELAHVINKNNELNEEISYLKEKLQIKEEAIKVIGRELIKKNALVNKMNDTAVFGAAKISVAKATQTAQTPSSPEASTSTPSTQAQGEAIGATAEVITPEDLPTNAVEVVAVQESQRESGDRDHISLANMPTTPVERSLYNYYKILLLMIGQRLLSSDITKFKEWASAEFAVNVSCDVWDVFLQLDQNKVISVMNLEKLREFFGRIIRIDVVHLIDCFNVGDYTYLGTASLSGAPRNRSTTATTRPTGAAVVEPQQPEEVLRNQNDPILPIPRQRALSNQATNETNGSSRSNVQTKVVKTPALSEERSRTTEQTTRSPMVTEESTNPNQQENDSFDGAETSRPRPQVDMGSNGRKLSKFQRPDSPDDDSQWLCSHYKRRCRVKFSCCDKYWPCHRCHNHETKCGKKKLKSRDTKFVKCEDCGTEQEFSENSQFCSNCNKKFARYFCAICKHLTGTDDNPYHCEQCGICRIHRDRSFHCDVCGVCLDVQLRGNHKCRAGSAHDECCICLEDAFTGCQILPCSHKVHKECATQMIRNGITRCPICRESFAHKLERRPIQSAKKRNGKK